MLAQLLTIKKLRERKAAAEVTQRRRALSQCQQAVIDAKKKLDEYIHWRSEEERRRFQSLMGKVTAYTQLESVNQDMSLLRKKDADYQQRIVKAEAEQAQAKQALAHSKQAHVLARRAVEKFDGLLSEEQLRQSKALVRIEELELEEFSKPRHDVTGR